MSVDKQFKYTSVTVLVFCAAFAVVPIRAQSIPHGFDVKDSIQMTTFSTPSGLQVGATFSISPDGKMFWFVTSKGIIRSNQVESTLWTLESKAVAHFLAGGSKMPLEVTPRHLALARISAVPRLLASNSYAPVISSVRWSEDSSKIYFLGQNSNGEAQLYEVNVRQHQVRTLSPKGYNVQQFDIRGVHIVYTALDSKGARASVPWDRNSEINRDAGAVTGLGLEDILLFPPETHELGSGTVLPDLWSGTESGFKRVPRKGEPAVDVGHSQNVLSISPDGRKVIRLLPISHIEPQWRFYDPEPGFESWRIKPSDTSLVSPKYWYRLREYMVTDTVTGETKTLIDGPSGESLAVQDRLLAVWSGDGKAALLSNVALPFDGVGIEDWVRHTNMCAVAVVQIQSLKPECVVYTRDAVNVTLTRENPHPLRLQEAFWGRDANEVELRFSWHEKWGETERYRREDGKWVLKEIIPGDPITGAALSQSSEKSPKSGNVTLRIRQDLNTPPTLWAREDATNKDKMLWDPNPQFTGMKFGVASMYHWKDKTGYTSTGILLLPPDYVVGRRYPLVIQTHGVWENIFVTSGSYSTAMAARPLSSAGIIVLQTQWNPTHFSDHQENADQVAMFEAAVKQLDGDGLIDKNRIGIIGFSRTCGHVEQSLIDNPSMFAAATIADGLDLGYLQYRLFAEGRPTMAKEFVKIVGATPEGDGLKAWTDYVPSFHMDSIKTPLRIEAIDPSSALAMWETYAVLREVKKPVDLIYIPDGQHILQRPLDRMASQQGNVDWFRFWLHGYEDPDPGKKDQYVRWRHLKDLQNAEDKASIQTRANASKLN